MIRKLGRKAVKTDTRTLRMARYLAPALVLPPAAVDWTKGVTAWGMMLNDTLGDCTIAGCGHAVQVWTLNVAGVMATVPDAVVEQYYGKFDGYVPGDVSTDNGGVELDVLTDWRAQGFAGHQLTGFADPAVADLVEVRQSINLFGGVYIGVNLPLSAQGQAVWDVVPDPGDGSTAPGSWGGHCVYVPKYDQAGFTCITWGGLQRMTTAFWQKYVDEAHTLLSQDWLAAAGLDDPQGFNLSQLQADLAAIT
jgi:hypothetical protein